MKKKKKKNLKHFITSLIKQELFYTRIFLIQINERSTISFISETVSEYKSCLPSKVCVFSVYSLFSSRRCNMTSRRQLVHYTNRSLDNLVVRPAFAVA